MGAIRGWKPSALLGVWALSCAGQTVPAEIRIAVYNIAKVGSKTLDRAEAVTGRILLAAGLDVQWSAGPVSELESLVIDFSPQRSGTCAGASVPHLLRVAVFARAPVGLPAQVLGFSLPCATTGIQVVVYADRVAKVSESTGPTFNRVLGYAMAHELGHVLRRSTGHEDNGLMKAVWSKRDWQRAAVSIIPFSPRQTVR